MPDRPTTHKQRPRRRASRRRHAIVRRATVRSLSVPFKVAAQPVYSLHDAVLTLLDGAIETLCCGQDDEAVHAARKTCKRIRAGLRLLRGCLGARAYRHENRIVRGAAKPLTAVRDAFMLRRMLRTLPLRAAIMRRSLDSEYRRERHALTHRGVQNALGQIMATRERLVDLPTVDSEAESVVAGVRRSYKAGRKAYSRARSGNDQALHEWRKQTKYLLNQLELIDAVFHAEFKKLHRRAERLTVTLGDDHDLGVLANRMRRQEVNEPSLTKQISKRRSKLQARAFRVGKHVYRHSASRLAAGLRARLLDRHWYQPT